MDSDHPTLGDADLRTTVLAGLAAVAELQARFRNPLERFLVGMCDRGDGRAREKSVEIAGQVLAECFTKSPSLLERWHGPDNLEAFLRTVAKNRLKSWWDSADGQQPKSLDDPLPAGDDSLPITAADRQIVELAELALRAGVAAAARDCPEGLLFMRLKGLHGVDQRAISRCWGHHEAQTSRRIKEAMDLIRSTATATAARHGCELTRDDLLQGLQRDPAILLGSAGADAPHGDFSLLKSLAEGGTDEAQRRGAVEMMCHDPQSLGFFAQALNRRNESQALVVTDPALSGMAARLTECIRRSLEILQPAEAAGMITPPMAGLLADYLNEVGADGGTLWLLCPGIAMLEAVFNPLEAEMAGKRQPLASGIVSLVLATGEPACVTDASIHQRHSPAIDIALGKTTRSMIAVPFVLAGTARGVLTAVRLSRAEPFDPAAPEMLVRCSHILADLMTASLTSRILG